MIINGIKHAIRMWIDNENNDTILEEVFGSLEEMNAFIENTWRSSEYVGFSAHFSPVDVINGEPDEYVRFIFDVEPYMPLEPSEVEEYYLEIEESFRFSQEISEHFGKNTKFEPRKNATDYVSKKKHREDITYICPYCFRELDDCRCSNYSYYLVQIDKLLVPVIRTLNQKGYITTACCSGHLEESHCVSIYIAFKDEHDFGSNLPAGAIYRKTDRMVEYRGPDQMDKVERAQFQRECITNLTAWANALPML